MLNRITGWRWIVLCAALLTTPAMAQDEAAAAERLNELLSAANTLTGNFSQMTLSSNGSNLQETSGQVTLQRPGKFRWHTDPPL